jgi:hypothetical protein
MKKETATSRQRTWHLSGGVMIEALPHMNAKQRLESGGHVGAVLAKQMVTRAGIVPRLHGYGSPQPASSPICNLCGVKTGRDVSFS